MFLRVATLALLPAIVVQGLKVKKNTPRLPEATGERQGRQGTGPKLSLLIVGDSATAGVGVETQQDALLGAILHILEKHFSVNWCLHAKSGDNSSKIMQNIETLQNAPYDVVITSVGVNDVTQFMGAKQWIAKQKQLYALIESKFSPKLMIVTGVPPMNEFPALPNPLGWLFGQYATQMNQKLKAWVQLHPNMQLIEYDLAQYRALNLSMAEDGFHPSKEVYQIWGSQVAEKIFQAI